MSRIALAIFACLCFIHACPGLRAQEPDVNTCPRPAIGSPVPEPEDLHSQNGVLRVDLTVHDYTDADGATRYCYLAPNGSESPTLRLGPGDLLILNLKNELKDPQPAAAATNQHHMQSEKSQNPCTSGFMSITSANLHFHGLTVPAVCRQDDVLRTSIPSGDPPFQYRFYIPKNEPPGLYWYHPHIHGFSTPQVLGGLSGALIIEGIERANKQVAGLPERVIIIRDQNLLNPDAPPSKSEPVVPKMLLDRDGDAANNGTGFGKPAKDLSINYVPVPYPDYPPASIQTKPGERQFWRVLNASAITYLNLEVLYKFKPQQLGIVALDGVPLNANGTNGDFIDWTPHIGIPPGGRAEFILFGPPLGVPGLLVTRTVDTGSGGENDTNRMLATITSSTDAPDPRAKLSSSPVPLPPPTLPWLGNVAPVRTRKLYFSEKLLDPKNPNSATVFYLTVEGQASKPFDPTSDVPNIVVHQGDVEDWIIENRSTELHAFHIHQLHFLMTAWRDVPMNEPFLRDTINVPYFDGRTLEYPSVTLRMDFRDPNTVGTFVYHCHLLEHEDGGMMGTIQVLPKDAPLPSTEKSPSTSPRKSTARTSTLDLYNDIAHNTLPAVSFVKPSGLVDGHPSSSKLNLFEGFTEKIVEAVQANPTLWQDTVIFITFDEGGGYYDSGYVQPLDFFGDGTRIPLIAVSNYNKPGYVSHVYTDHVSIDKFIERNWSLGPITTRSRDNFPSPTTAADDPYVPTNGPAIGDLWDMFTFSSSNTD